ncbi:MAG: helix-turn-helix domain-containing protein [Deltaproteobacteria bacterium]|nr:helix-turn-helix domain-containing protein [Deltaproteobacteria bacterium]
MEEPKTPFQAALAFCVQEHGRQSKLAKKIGVTPQTISAIVNGLSEGTQKTRLAIAGALGMTYEEFLALGNRIMGGGGEPPGRGVDAAVTGEDAIGLPSWEAPPRPLAPDERRYLEWALEVLRSGDLAQSAVDLLKASIVNCREQVEDRGRPKREPTGRKQGSASEVHRGAVNGGAKG